MEFSERKHFEAILVKLHAGILETEGRISAATLNLRQNQQYLWENVHEIDGAEKSSVRQSIAIAGLTGESLVKKRERLRKLLDSPYFGRIDFAENSSKHPVPLYIGVHPFHEECSGANLIYDWRAPIASMFYDCEIGAARYQSPSGIVRGSITRKRQFRIRKGIIEFMLESSLNIHDDILQKELSTTSDERMKTIVATIQKDQNRIIRDESSPVLIIQGAAGSGKTSIALHRVAFLLYSHRESIASRNIMIISPNSVFADYISNVLPELGEEEIPETSFERIAATELGKKIRSESFFDQVSRLLESPDPDYVERIRFKATRAFLEKLREFASHIENDYFVPSDVSVGKLVVDADFVARRYRSYQGKPIRTRLTNTANDIVRKIKMSPGFVRGVHKVAGIHAAVGKMFRTTNLMKLYREFYAWCGDASMHEVRRGGVLEHSDVFPLVYLKIRLEGPVAAYDEVKHVVVDEMQDYTPVQYAVLLKLLACKMTILGDANQSVNPYGSSTYHEIQGVLAGSECYRLNKSYRSSYEIMEFAQGIRRNEDLIPIERRGEKPVVKILDTEEEQILEILKDIEAGRERHGSIGIICKTQRAALELRERLGFPESLVSLLTPESRHFRRGVVITTAHMAKGLEFDQVIIPFADPRTYRTEIDRSMLYIACTRALHSLRVFSVRELTPFVRMERTGQTWM